MYKEAITKSCIYHSLIWCQSVRETKYYIIIPAILQIIFIYRWLNQTLGKHVLILGVLLFGILC